MATMPSAEHGESDHADDDAVAEIGLWAGRAIGRASALAQRRFASRHAAFPRCRRRSRLTRVELHEQRFGVAEHGISVEKSPGDEDLAALGAVDPRVDLQLLIDGRDLAVVHVQVGRALRMGCE